MVGNTERGMNGRADVGAAIKNVTSTIGSAVTDAKDKAVNYAEEVGTQAVQTIKDKGGQQVRVLSDAIKDQPVSAVLIAAGIGILTGLMWRRNR